MRPLQNLTGQRFGSLVVQERAENTSTGHVRWRCLCDCGTTTDVAAGSLRNGATKSCGCGKHQPSKLAHDLVGQRFGKLVVLERAGSHRGAALWACACDCGKNTVTPSNKLVSGRTQSCGCLIGFRHGYTGVGWVSPTYSSWRNMIARCTQPSNPAYEHYQRLGISVCERWRSFENFLADVGERPTPAHTLDRWPNNDGNYEPGNVRWAVKREQANNRRTNRLFEYEGETITFAELVRRTGLPKAFLRHRLLRAGWPLEKALTAAKQQGARTDLLSDQAGGVAELPADEGAAPRSGPAVER